MVVVVFCCCYCCVYLQELGLACPWVTTQQDIDLRTKLATPRILEVLPSAVVLDTEVGVGVMLIELPGVNNQKK